MFEERLFHPTTHNNPTPGTKIASNFDAAAQHPSGRSALQPSKLSINFSLLHLCSFTNSNGVEVN